MKCENSEYKFDSVVYIIHTLVASCPHSKQGYFEELIPHMTNTSIIINCRKNEEL